MKKEEEQYQLFLLRVKAEELHCFNGKEEVEVLRKEIKKKFKQKEDMSS